MNNNPKNKWPQRPDAEVAGVESKRQSSTTGNVGAGTYMPQYAKRASPRFSPKKTVRSFRDLEVYQKTMECSILVSKYIMPELKEQKYPLIEGMTNCALSIPLYIAEAHGMRFSDFDRAVATLERAMQSCNKMIVYLEQASGLYPKDLDSALIEDLMKKYITVRGKMLRLEKSWKRFQAVPHIRK